MANDKKFCMKCGADIFQEAEICPKCGVKQPSLKNNQERNKITAALFGIFLGNFGVHKFYLGRNGWGILYLLFFWTFVPGFVGFIEGIIYLTMSDESFSEKYNK